MLHSIVFLTLPPHMFQACPWWRLLPATRTPTRGRSSTPFPQAAHEMLNTLESRAPRSWRSQINRPRRRPSTKLPPYSLRLLLQSQPCKLRALRLKSRDSAVRCHQPKRPWSRLSQTLCPSPQKPLADKRPLVVRSRTDPKVVQLSRLANPQATPTMTPTRRSATKKLISSVMAIS